MRKFNYCGVSRPHRVSSTIYSTFVERTKRFSKAKNPFETIGDRLLLSFRYGADVGPTITPKYDTSADNGNVDVLCSPDHDFFDIAEQFGKLAPQQSVVLRSTEESNDIDA